MNRERINKALRNEAQIQVAQRHLVAATAKAEKWKNCLERLEREQLAIRMESQLPLGPSTKKNQKKYVVWHTVNELLTEPYASAGLTTVELFEATRNEHLTLNLITFRAYLREFSSHERRLIQKQDDRWHVADFAKKATSILRR